MTEAKWLVSDDLHQLNRCATNDSRKKSTPFPPITRRLGTLFGVACLRATPEVEGQPFLKTAVGVVERAADSDKWREVDRLGVRATRNCSEAVAVAGLDSVPHFWALAGLRLTTSGMQLNAWHVPFFVLKALDGSGSVPLLRKCYADFLRDIAGNPFRGGRGRRMKNPTRAHKFPVLRESHVTSDVLALARTMYESREFSAMPILADALQDAGCENAEILNHCRDTSLTHVRGCWVVDLVLGKA